MPFPLVHLFRRPAVVAWITLAVLSVGLAYSDAVPQLRRTWPALAGTRGPCNVAFTPDGQRALVTEFDEGALAIVDRKTGAVLHHVATGGQEPTGVAVTPNGATAVVTNSFSGSVAFVDLQTLKATT